MYLGVEIGGTKLQVGVGPGDGTLAGLWRGTVDAAAGGAGIRDRIPAAVAELLASSGVGRGDLRGVGIGFGGPTDDATRSTITSHQIAGWDGFPLCDWAERTLGLPAVLGNDADVAGLGEALAGAGRGRSPVFYVTVGSGVGGGLVVDGRIFRGCGRGAAEVGHLRVRHGDRFVTVESLASGWGLQERYREATGRIATVAEMAAADDAVARRVLGDGLDALAEGLCHVITLVCPRVIVVGGGVSLLGEGLFFAPLRRRVAERVFKPFAGLTEVVPAALGEAVVVHGALALAAGV